MLGTPIDDIYGNRHMGKLWKPLEQLETNMWKTAQHVIRFYHVLPYFTHMLQSDITEKSGETFEQRW